MPEELDAQIASVAALGEPVRRELYLYVVTQGHPVSREQAAAGSGVAVHTAKFHLDRLVADGLLEAEYARPPGRTGPGAGRPTKLYRRSARAISVSLPERHYELPGRVMAEAITLAARDSVPLADALRGAARAAGRELAAEEPGSSVTQVLAAHGYEPRSTGSGEVILANCPFHDLAQQYTELICGINLDLVDGVIDAAGQTQLCARLDPAPGRCCVAIGEA